MSGRVVEPTGYGELLTRLKAEEVRLLFDRQPRSAARWVSHLHQPRGPDPQTVFGAISRR